MDDCLIIVKQTILNIIQTIRIFCCGVNLQDKDEHERAAEQQGVHLCSNPQTHWQQSHCELKSICYLVLQQH